MKPTLFSLTLIITLGFLLSACGTIDKGSPNQESEDNQPAKNKETEQKEKNLLFYNSGVRVNFYAGYTSNEYGFAVAGRASYYFANQLTLGALYSSNYNFLFVATLQATQRGGEIGYAFPNAPIIARPYLQAGSMSLETRFILFTDRRETTTRFYTAPGLEIIIPLQNGVMQFSFDTRYTLVPNLSEVNSFGLFLGLGFRF